MDSIRFDRQHPSNLSTLVVGFSGWTNAGGASVGAIRSLVRRLPGEHLATIDPEEFIDFTQVRPRVSNTPDGTRRIEWPSNDFYTWQPSGRPAGVLLLNGSEPNLKWRTYSKLVLDLAEACGVHQIVSVAAMQSDVPHTRPPVVTGSSNDPEWEPLLQEWGLSRQRRPSYQGPIGITSILREVAAERGVTYTSFMAQSPHYLQIGYNPPLIHTVLVYVRRLLGLEIDLSRLEERARQFRARADEVIARSEPATQAYIRKLEQDYDQAEGNQLDLGGEEVDPQKLVQDVEDFLRGQLE